ncbi:hypothetical protein ACROYT_G035967 [Oculina patagonica]
MAAAPDPKEVLLSTSGKANFQRVTQLLVSGGTALLREIFDQLCPPSNLPTILKNPATMIRLKAAELAMPEWNCLYPSTGVYGKSVDFDFILLFRLLRTICNLIPPTVGWDHLPTSTDHSLAADLARIKYYRNTVYGRPKPNMEITDDEFPQLWQEISTALVRIAGHISQRRKLEWQMAIDKLFEETEIQERVESLEKAVTDEAQDIEKQKQEKQEITALEVEHLQTRGQLTFQTRNPASTAKKLAAKNPAPARNPTENSTENLLRFWPPGNPLESGKLAKPHSKLMAAGNSFIGMIYGGHKSHQYFSCQNFV